MEIQERTLEFGVRVLKFANKLPNTIAGTTLAKQWIRSGTSVGANMEEAGGAATKADFVNKVTIARKEARETRYWLYLIKKANLVDPHDNEDELEELAKESHEIVLILSAIISKTKEKRNAFIK